MTAIKSALSKYELVLSREKYNSLRDVPQQLRQEAPDAFIALSNLISTYGVEKRFKINANHCHRRLPDNHVLVGVDIPHVRGYWSIPTSIEQVQDEGLYGNVFAIDNDNGGWIATELRRGQPSILDDQETKFLRHYRELATQMGCDSIFGLRLASLPSDAMVEFCFNPGLLLLDEHFLNSDWSGLQCTCWTTVKKDDEVLCEESIKCLPNLQGTHDETKDGETWAADEAIQYLREGGVVKVG